MEGAGLGGARQEQSQEALDLGWRGRIGGGARPVNSLEEQRAAQRNRRRVASFARGGP
jgi:hypothetical protein